MNHHYYFQMPKRILLYFACRLVALLILNTQKFLESLWLDNNFKDKVPHEVEFTLCIFIVFGAGVKSDGISVFTWLICSVVSCIGTIDGIILPRFILSKSSTLYVNWSTRITCHNVLNSFFNI